MSVKIIQREEKRNTSLRDFLLVATLPLLLMLAVGFLLGSTRAGDVEKNEATISELRADNKQLRAEYDELTRYVFVVDSLHDELADDLVELHETRRDAFGQPTTSVSEDPIAIWWKEVTITQREYQVELAEVVGQLEANKILTRKQINQVSSLFTAYNEQANNNLSTHKSARERYGQTQNSCDTEIEDLREEHRKEVDDYKRKLDRDADKIDDLNDDKQNLIAQLANTGKVVCPDNAPQKGAIKDAVSELVAVVEGLNTQGGLLKLNKKDREEVRAAQIEVKKLGQEIRDQASEVQ